MAGIGTPLLFGRTFQPVAVLHGRGGVVVVRAVFQTNRIVAPGYPNGLTATVEEGVGIVADVDAPYVGTHLLRLTVGLGALLQT